MDNEPTGMHVIFASGKYAVLRDRDGWADIVRNDGQEKQLGGHSSANAILTVDSFKAAGLGSFSEGARTAIDLYLDGFFL